MPIAYRIDQEAGVSLVVWDGMITAEEFLAHARRICADPDWPTGRRRHLTDLRSGTLDASITLPVLQQAADIYGAHPSIASLKVALVSAPNYREAVQFERLFLRYQTRVVVFTTLDEGCTWLGLDLRRTEQALAALREEARAAAHP